LEQSRARLALLLALIAGVAALGWIGWQVARPAAPVESPLDDVRRVVPADRRVVVEVLNGTQRRGAARIAMRMLRQAGFDVLYFGDAPASADTTLVLVRRGEREPGEWLLDALGTGQLRLEPDSLRRVDLTVILGPDWRLPGGVIP
jgi:hypothetical protein